MIIGSNKQKDNIVQQGMVPRLIQLLGDPIASDELKLEGQINKMFTQPKDYDNLMLICLFLIPVITVIGSLARGDENHIKSLTSAGVIPFLLNSKWIYV